jgi:dihydroflavonol-4-reductase
MFRSNVDGTRSLLAAAQKAGVERCVYTSTVGCIGMRKGDLGSEDTPAVLEDMQGPYKRSKFQAEQIAIEFAEQGFPVVIVNPTAPVGDHDFRPTPTGKIVVDFLRGAMPAYLDTGLNVVYVGDVAAGRGGIRRGGGLDGMGGSDRKRAACAARWCTDGAEENVGAAR